MKTIKNIIIVFLLMITSQNFYSQYHGGNADGAAVEEFSVTSCPNPAHFYAYFGGNNDGASVDNLINTICPASNHFYAYFGGTGDGAGVETIETTICSFPSSFYAYFGGNSDGFSLDATAPICPTEPPVASFTASATAVCVGQSVTFTDTSTNSPSAWTWTLPGATPNNAIVQNPTVVYNTPGSYTVTLKAANFNGFDTKVLTNYITVTAYPTVTSVTPASRCDAGTVTLNATASAGTLNWYANATGGTALGTGSSFVTPSISATTTYYAEVANGTCTSLARTAVIATVNTTPTITSTTPNSRCGTGTVVLSAAASNGTLSWFANATGGTALGTGTSFTTPSIAVTTTYYVAASAGSCSSSRSAVIATINVTPTITSTTPGFACDSGPVTLQATTTSGTISWFTAASGGTAIATGTIFTTPYLTQSTTYYVEAVNGSCTSARVAIVASVYPTPLVTSVTQVTPICVSGSTILTATSNYNGTNTWAWYDAPTGGNLLSTSISYVTPVITTNTTYYVAVDRFGCTSPRTAITATVTPTPTITSTTPGSRCGTGSVTLSATASAGDISWWDAPTGGSNVGIGATLNTPSISSTTIYYVQTTDNTCVSARTAVVATVNQTPTVTSTTPGARCGAGTVTLSAVANSGTINWFATASGGTSLATGSSFTTPSISATTTYYVEASNGTCASIRTAVTATVNVTPSITATTPGSRCDSGSVILFASANTGTLNWYNAATGGTLVGTGGLFTTPSISSTTTYYVEAVNGSCASVRSAVVATVNAGPTITSTTPTTICSGNSFTIAATASSGTVNWYNQPSGGSFLATGSTYSLPSLGSTTTYYAQAIDGSCTSARTAVVVTVNTAPTITSTTPNSRCGTGMVVLGATASNGTLSWFANATGGTALGTGTSFTTPSIAVTTTYYVEATNGTCTSLARTAVTATVNTVPTITSTTPNSRCGTGTVVLGATASNGTLSWFANATGGTTLGTGTSFTTPSIAVTTTYYVEATNGTCTSLARTAVTATVNTVPTITSTTPNSRCGTGTVVLGATAANGTLSWYANATGGTALGTGTSFTTPSIAVTTTYYVEASAGSCTSARTAVIATINAIPVITSTTPASRCGDGAVTLQATASIGTINWYNAPTGGSLVATGGSFTTPVLGTTTIYYVEVVNGGCNSARTAVSATVFAVASITSTTPASRCDAGTLTLQATSSVGTLSWFANATGGTSLGSGTSFTTPSISATTTYYVEANNGACTSSRVAVTASINPIAAPTGIANQTFCTGETVELILVSGSNVVWYDAASGGNVVPSGTALVSGTTYYASQTVSGCESPTRLAVTMTSGGCLRNEEFLFKRIVVYPNPVLNVVTISNTEPISEIQLLDMMGRVLQIRKSDGLEEKIEMSHLPAAPYLIKVKINGQIKTFKIIKK